MINGIGLKVYIAGVCGISMSAIAKVLKEEGHIVCGSDEKTEGQIIDDLNLHGIQTFSNLCTDGIVKVNPETFIYSVAIKEENPEFIYSKCNNIQVMSRGEALGLISQSFQKTVAISGSHGKTTTTALLSHIFLNSKRDISCHIGGIVKNINSNYHLGQKREIFVTEACEYHDSFLNLNPDVAVVLNIGDDHLDYFKSKENIKSSFLKFINKVKIGGVVVLNIDDEYLLSISENIRKKYRVITYSKFNNNADVYIVNNRKLAGGRIVFDCSYFGAVIDNVHLSMVGEHNLYNAMVSLIVSKEFGVNDSQIVESIASFAGVKRRYEYITKLNGAEVIHDYAHHPDEIDAVVGETLSITEGNLYVVFEPHTYTRTKRLWDDFIRVLRKPYRVILLPIYPARENPIQDVSSENLCYHINKNGGASYFVPNYDVLYCILHRLVKDNDKVLILGAGDIVNFTEYLLTR